jgi:AcrR family transcriptional regulator
MTDPAASTPADDKPPTRWGDREQRRIDILDAARALIEERGYIALNMRGLAADAGVSPATLYSYFATKEELFATLYAQAIRNYTTDFSSLLDDEPGLESLFGGLVELYVELYRRYGRHYDTWSMSRRDADAPPSIARDVLLELRAAAVAHNAVQMPAVAASAARDGRRIRDPEVAPSLLWAFLSGIADHVTSERGDLDPYSRERFLAGAVDGLAAALTEPV